MVQEAVLGECLVDNIVKYKDIIRDPTGMELCLNTCRLLFGIGNVTQQLNSHGTADQHGIKSSPRGRR
jgi:hypothetical protein